MSAPQKKWLRLPRGRWGPPATRFLIMLLACASLAHEARGKATTSAANRDNVGPEEPADATHITERLPEIRQILGEEATYEGILYIAGVPLKVGTATFRVTESQEGDRPIILSVDARGGALGYSVKAKATSTLDPVTCLPRQFFTMREGSENKAKRLDFTTDRILYVKKKHCRDPACTNPAHMVQPKMPLGILPRPGPPTHCTGCDDPRHAVWTLRYTHEVQTAFLDVLSALFAARAGDFTVGQSFIVPVVEDRDRWHVTVTSLADETVTVKAGSFDCVKVRLLPKNTGEPKRRDKFSALFGIKGNLRLWVDRETHVPVRIAGVLPFAFLELDCEVKLVSRRSPNSGGRKCHSAHRTDTTTRETEKPAPPNKPGQQTRQQP